VWGLGFCFEFFSRINAVLFDDWYKALAGFMAGGSKIGFILDFDSPD
jgi:hypothetical protein